MIYIDYWYKYLDQEVSIMMSSCTSSHLDDPAHDTTVEIKKQEHLRETFQAKWMQSTNIW